VIRIACAASLAAALATVGARAAEPAAATDAHGPLTSQVDVTRPGARDLPIRCVPGDVEYFAGRTLGDVFGSAWPEAPPGARVEPARVLQSAPPTWPRGLGQAHAVAVVAILVGPDGRAIDARAICASTPAMAGPAVRAALRSVYAPALFDGVPGTGVAVRPYVFVVRDRPSSPVPDRPGRPARR
jgi:hypothetical protein